MHCAADSESLTEVIVVRGLTCTDDCRDRRDSVAVCREVWSAMSLSSDRKARVPATEQRSLTVGSALSQLSGNPQLPTCVRIMLAGGPSS
jgi:hypothetical protein